MRLTELSSCPADNLNESTSSWKTKEKQNHFSWAMELYNKYIP